MDGAFGEKTGKVKKLTGSDLGFYDYKRMKEAQDHYFLLVEGSSDFQGSYSIGGNDRFDNVFNRVYSKRFISLSKIEQLIARKNKKEEGETWNRKKKSLKNPKDRLEYESKAKAIFESEFATE